MVPLFLKILESKYSMIRSAQENPLDCKEKLQKMPTYLKLLCASMHVQDCKFTTTEGRLEYSLSTVTS